MLEVLRLMLRLLLEGERLLLEAVMLRLGLEIMRLLLLVEGECG